MRPSYPNLLLPLAASLVLSSCARPGPPLPPSLETPRPVTDLRAVRKGDRVYLRWTVPTQTTDGQTVRSLGMTQICRSLDPAMKQCGTPVASVPTSQPASPTPAESGKSPSTAEATYTDALPPEIQAQSGKDVVAYAVDVPNADGRDAGLSNRVVVPSAPALPPPTDFAAKATGDGITLSWTASPPPQTSLKFIWRIYRRQEGSATALVAGEVPFGSPPEFVDHSFEWEKTYDYRIIAVTVIPQEGKLDLQVEGDDSPPVKVFADDVFPPSVPSGLQAVFSGVGQPPFIDLIWAPGTEPDLAGYNVYRHEEGASPAKLNVEPVRTPAFRDANVQSGKKYFYSVSAVDVRNNESGRSEEASEQVP
jgi:hypothetical protein